MKIEISRSQFASTCTANGGIAENERYGEVGLRLMNVMWQVVKGATIPTTGIIVRSDTKGERCAGHAVPRHAEHRASQFKARRPTTK